MDADALKGVGETLKKVVRGSNLPGELTMRWARRGMVLGVLGACSAMAADGPKLEPPARPTRSEVEGRAVASAPRLQVPEGGQDVTAVGPREGLPPIYRPPAPPVPVLDQFSPGAGGRVTRPESSKGEGLGAQPEPATPILGVPTDWPVPVLGTPTASTGEVETQAGLPPALERPNAITLEAVPDLSAFDLKPLGGRVEPAPSRERQERPPIRIEPEPRRRGFFGLFRREPAEERYEPALQTDERPGRSMSAPKSDPSVDSALRRKVQAQAERALGRHLRDLDVRVIAQKITIRARADFFWNRRGIRKGLADLLAIRGHETTIEVD